MANKHFPLTSAVAGVALLVGLTVGVSPVLAAGGGVAPITKVTSGNNFAVAVDNGFVLYQSLVGGPTLSVFDPTSQTLKIQQAGFGSSVGQQLDAGGITFGPCAPAAGNSCQPTTVNGTPGIGVGFGQVWVPGSSPSVGGWFNDDALKAHITDAASGGVGSIIAVTIDATNGSYAIGWHTDSITGNKHGLVWSLDSNYKPIGAGIDLAPIGAGQTDIALAASQHSSFVVGTADFNVTKVGFGHAVYAALGTTPATSWTDATTTWPGTALGYSTAKSKSLALAANDTGTIAGTVWVTESNVAGHKSQSLPIGFVQSVSPTLGAPTFFGPAAAEVIPMKVLANGDVIGELDFIPPAGSGVLGSYHPFVFSGGVLTDLYCSPNPSSATCAPGTAFAGPKSGTFTASPPYSCRVDSADTVGEMVGTCTATSTSPINVTGKAFYINAEPVAAATFEDLNAVLHANFDCTISNSPPLPAGCIQNFKSFNMGVGSAVDDQHEVVFIGAAFSNSGGIQRQVWLAEPGAY